MDTLFLQKPAFYAHVLSALCFAVGLLILLFHVSTLRRMNPMTLAALFFLLSIALASHAQGHIALEHAYGYAPLSLLKSV